MLLQLGGEAHEHICTYESCTLKISWISDGVTAMVYWQMCFEIPKSTTTIVDYLYKEDFVIFIYICISSLLIH